MEPKLQLGSCDQNLPNFILQNLESDTQFFYTIDNPRIHYNCRINELHGRRMHGCFHGWVILSNHQNDTLWSLWNPLTSNSIHLPPLPLAYKGKDFHYCCLSSPPGEEASSVFLLLSPSVHTILFCALDSKRKRFKWSETSYAETLKSIIGDDEEDCYLCFPTCCNGKVYAMSMPSTIFLIELDIKQSKEVVIISLLPSVQLPLASSYDPRPCRNDLGTHSGMSFLKGSFMDLFYISVDFIGENIDNVYLFKLDMASMTWKEMVEFEDALFFLKIDVNPACYYMPAVGSKFGGYIHLACDSEKIIYSFRPKDRTVFLSSMSSLVPESQMSASAMLEYWRLEADHVESKQEADTEIVVRPVKGDNTSSDSHLLNMPLDMLELIMEHCIGVEYMKFRATCKHCYLAAPSIQWKDKTRLSRLNCYSLVSPWLMVLDNDRDTITFTDPLFGDMYFMNTPQELTGGNYRIYCSRYGWLLMYKGEVGEKRLVFYNPFTGNILKLELPEVEYLESFCFSAPPTSRDCMVVGFTSYGPWHVYIHFVSQESIWREYALAFDGDPYSHQFPAFSGGREIYALCNNGKIEAFKDMNRDELFSWHYVARNGPISRCKSVETHYFLSSCDQHLLLIIVGVYGESVEVFKLNQSTGEWEKIDGLGKHMIYISKTSCICVEAASPEMGNKIYFPRSLHDKDTKIVFYSLETCRYHTFDDKIIQESFGDDLYGTKYHCNPHIWIEPSWC